MLYYIPNCFPVRMNETLVTPFINAIRNETPFEQFTDKKNNKFNLRTKKCKTEYKQIK